MNRVQHPLEVYGDPTSNRRVRVHKLMLEVLQRLCWQVILAEALLAG